MNPAEVVRHASADGVTLSATGKVKASGNQEAVNSWLIITNYIRAGILELLHSPPQTHQEALEYE